MMQTTNYFVNAYATIRWDNGCQAVVVVWHKYAPSAEYRQVKNKVIELLALQHGNQVLTDDTNRGVIDLKDQEWTAKDWFPRAVAAGYVRMARVAPVNLLTKMAVDRTRQHLDSGNFEEAQFGTYEEARAWLMRQPKTTKTPTPTIKPSLVTSPTNTLTIYLETSFYTIKWSEAGKFVYTQAKSFMDGSTFRSQMEKTSELLHRRKATGCVVDIRNVNIIALESQDFLMVEWPQKLPESLRRLALIFPSSATMQMATKRITRQKASWKFEQAFFDSEAEAIKWVAQAKI